MASQIEEIVMYPDLIQLENLAPDLRQLFFN